MILKPGSLDSEHVVLCSVLAVGDGAIERGPGRAVEPDRVVRSLSDDSDEPEADEVD